MFKVVLAAQSQLPRVLVPRVTARLSVRFRLDTSFLLPREYFILGEYCSIFTYSYAADCSE